jgi:hypothetical protein
VFKWANEAIFVMLSDGDTRGRDCLSAQVCGHCDADVSTHVGVFWPESTVAKNFNDWWDLRLPTADQFLEKLRRKTAVPVVTLRSARVPFTTYFKKESKRDDELGAAAKLIVSGDARPKGRRPFKEWQCWWIHTLPAELHDAARALWKAWSALPTP